MDEKAGGPGADTSSQVLSPIGLPWTLKLRCALSSSSKTEPIQKDSVLPIRAIMLRDRDLADLLGPR